MTIKFERRGPQNRARRAGFGPWAASLTSLLQSKLFRSEFMFKKRLEI